MRQSFARLAAVILALALPAPAAAVEVFATPDETQTSGDCLSEATACALGKALDVWDPEVLGVPFPPTPAPGTQILTLLPGRYDKTDLTVPSGSFTQFDISIRRGAVVRGKPGAPKPEIAIGDTGFAKPAIDIGSGGTLSDVVVDATSFIGVEAQGLVAAPGDPQGVDILARVERVKIISAPQTGQDESYGLSLSPLSVVANVDVDHRSPKGAAISVSAPVADIAAPRLAGITATSPQATALESAPDPVVPPASSRSRSRTPCCAARRTSSRTPTSSAARCSRAVRRRSRSR